MKWHLVQHFFKNNLDPKNNNVGQINKMNKKWLFLFFIHTAINPLYINDKHIMQN